MRLSITPSALIVWAHSTIEQRLNNTFTFDVSTQNRNNLNICYAKSLRNYTWLSFYHSIITHQGQSTIYSSKVGHRRLLPEQPGSDISHLTIIQLLVSASIRIDSNKAESRYDSFHIKSHAAEPINQIFVVSAVSEVQP